VSNFSRAEDIYENSLYGYTHWDRITTVSNAGAWGHKLILSGGPGRNFLPEDIIVLRGISWETRVLLQGSKVKNRKKK